jgi:predicted N-formylglutamate amidohydrolase
VHRPTLLTPDDPPPFDVFGEGDPAPYVFVCDHAGRALPRALGSLGVAPAELERHIAWDIGAARLARRLRDALGGFLILQNYSRLVIDCNRPLTSPDSMVTRSEDTPIPGNEALSREHVELRVASIFEPYHARIRQELDERKLDGRRAFLIFLHSFTPVYRGVARSWHAGVLHLDDARVARALLAGLRNEPGLVVGDNEPYAASVLTDYGLVEHAERRGLPYVELEVRQRSAHRRTGALELGRAPRAPAPARIRHRLSGRPCREMTR